MSVLKQTGLTRWSPELSKAPTSEGAAKPRTQNNRRSLRKRPRLTMRTTSSFRPLLDRSCQAPTLSKIHAFAVKYSVHDLSHPPQLLDLFAQFIPIPPRHFLPSARRRHASVEPMKQLPHIHQGETACLSETKHRGRVCRVARISALFSVTCRAVPRWCKSQTMWSPPRSKNGNASESSWTSAQPHRKINKLATKHEPKDVLSILNGGCRDFGVPVSC